MDARLSGNLDALDDSNGVIQLLARLLEAAFHRLPARGHASVRGEDELHQLRDEREEVVSTAVFVLSAAVRDAAGHRQGGGDLARMHRALHDRRAEEHGRLAVRVRERRRARPLDARERFPGSGQGYSVSGRGRPHDRGRVSWGWVVVLRNRKRQLRRPRTTLGGVSFELFHLLLAVLRLITDEGGIRRRVDAAAAVRRCHSDRDTLPRCCNEPRSVVVGCGAWPAERFGFLQVRRNESHTTYTTYIPRISATPRISAATRIQYEPHTPFIRRLRYKHKKMISKESHLV